MSGIGSINSSPSIYQSIQSSQGNSIEEPEAKGSGRFESRISNILQEAGVDTDTAEALKEDLKALFEKIRSSGGKEPEDLNSAIDSIFEKYNLDAEDILGARASQAGFGESGQETSGAASTVSSLLETLFSQQKESGALSADSLLDGLMGLDAVA
ncbi:hypothetical protein [uncultured Gimesia sp.]|uniref:hypothetical protein n=1 Tax=uncultured Gimesia sp. TaxID=1678688 RepID=UPI0030D7DD3B|tara:strand:+ start:121462 stop:121926 length:465 start_codon:yes stop_codon:yes gene_type:complete